MNSALALARSYGVGIRFADLGDWGRSELVSEYDPRGPEIRLNLRVAQQLPLAELGAFVTLAVAHELYHHRERLGEVEVIVQREDRERAAGEYARRLLHDGS